SSSFNSSSIRSASGEAEDERAHDELTSVELAHGAGQECPASWFPRVRGGRAYRRRAAHICATAFAHFDDVVARLGDIPARAFLSRSRGWRTTTLLGPPDSSTARVGRIGLGAEFSLASTKRESTGSPRC